MSDSGWAILVIMAIIIMSWAPDLIWMGGLILIGVWAINSTKRALDRGEDPPGLVELIEDLFKKDR